MATTAEQRAATKVVTGEVRLSYVHLFQPFSNIDGAEPKYSVVLVIPKKDKVTIKKLRDAQQAALEAGKAKFGGKIPKVWKDTIHDGDEEADLEKSPELEGCIYLTVSNKTRPGVVDRRLNEIDDPTEVYSGCYARVSLNAFAFNTGGSKGVSFGLNHVQKLRDGEPLDGRTKAEDDFDSLDDDESDDGDENLI